MRRPLLLLLLLPSTATSYGGFFGRAAPEEPISVKGDAIVFALHDNKVQLQVQLEYDHATQDEAFGWILPVPAVPSKLDIGSSLLMNSLFQATLPTFLLDIDGSPETVATVDSTSLGKVCPASILEDPNCPVQGPTRSSTGPGVNVRAQGHAGLVSYKVLEGSSSAVLEWLESTEWNSGVGNLENLLQYYDASGSVYVVLKVNPSTVEGAVQPVLIEYELPAQSSHVHKVPTLLSVAAPRTLQIYFLTHQANTRAVPINYLDVELDDSYADWVGCLAADEGPDACYYQDYQKRYRDAVAPVVNQTFTTEYYGPASVLADKIKLDIAIDIDKASTWEDYLHLLEDAGVPPIPAVQGVLDQFIPPKQFQFMPPFQCAQWEHVYQPFRTVSPSMHDCFEIFDPPTGWTWDPVGLTAQLETHVFAPARQAQDLVASMNSLTRLYGELVAPTTTPEPHFMLTSNMPLVSNVHRASAVPLCDDFGSTSALEITLDNANDPRTFWQPALLSCPTWKKTSPKPILDASAADSHSLATLFAAWGGEAPYLVPRDEAGAFSNNDIVAALTYGDGLLATMTDQPQGEFPGVPLSGTTYIDATAATSQSENYGGGGGGSDDKKYSEDTAATWESENYRGGGLESSSSRRSWAMATTILALVAGLFL